MTAIAADVVLVLACLAMITLSTTESIHATVVGTWEIWILKSDLRYCSAAFSQLLMELEVSLSRPEEMKYKK